MLTLYPKLMMTLYHYTEGEDFLLTSTMLTFMPGEPQTLSMEIQLVDDEFFEGREDFTLQLRTSQERVLLTTGTTLVAIVDNEGDAG